MTVDIEGNTAHVSWDPPMEANGDIDKYNITVDGVVVKTVDAPKTSMDLPNRCGSFTVTVRASNQAGWGPDSEPQLASIDDNGECKINSDSSLSIL